MPLYRLPGADRGARAVGAQRTRKEAILAKKTSSEIRRISVETSGLVTLLEDGIAKAAQGLTTLYEVLRCLPRLGKPRPVGEILHLVGKVNG